MSRIKEPDTQLNAAMGFASLMRNPEYTEKERQSFLIYAIMHACQASVYAYQNPLKWGFTVDDFKHRLMRAAEMVMQGKPIKEVAEQIENYQPTFPLVILED